MFRKIVWCYFIVLALLDISLNTKLSAQGKSHGNGASMHESLMEGISLQEWGKEDPAGEAVRGRGAAPAEAAALWPAALDFGAVPLCEPHARTLTLTNTHNETLHLASVAGTTPDFHASFFQTKTLVPQANTTFSVVYLGRREGPVSTHLYIHTSAGVIRYPVRATGLASAYRVWPLAGLRVPLNASLEPTLALYNPTDTTIQVTEVYSSGAWLGLRLAGGGDSAPRAAWTLPPHSARPLVRLALRPVAHAPAHAYVRIKGNMTGGALVLAVEAAAAPPGEFLHPLQLRLRARGSRDPPHTFTLEAGNSAGAAARLDAEVWGARCAAARPAEPPPPPPASAAAPPNGGPRSAAGASVALLRRELEAHQPLTPVATLTLDYGSLWRGAATEAAAAAAGGAWCEGWVRVGRAAAPWSLRLLRGTLALSPAELHVVTAHGHAYEEREVLARNDFPVPVHIEHVHFPPEIQEHFHTESLAPLVVRVGGAGSVLRVRLRAGPHPLSLAHNITLRTNLTDYTLPLLLYDGLLHIEWEWPQGADGTLRVGAVSASSTRRVGARLHNTGPVALCATAVRAQLPGASFAVSGARCVAPGGSARAVLAVVAPATPGPVRGSVAVGTAHGSARAAVSLEAHAGRVEAPPVLLAGAAPYVPARGSLVVLSSMALRMHVTRVHQPSPDPALRCELPAEEAAREVVPPRRTVATLHYWAEDACRPACATGLQLDTPEGAAWAARGDSDVAADEALYAARRDSFPTGVTSVPLELHTTRVALLNAAAAVQWRWPALLEAAPARALAALHGAAPLELRAHNPARVPLLLQAAVRGAAAWSAGAWAVLEGGAAPWAQDPRYMMLQPRATVALQLAFTPAAPGTHRATLHLRNNLTVLESVPLEGVGVLPAFLLGGLPPNSSAALSLEVLECGAGAGVARRTLAVTNTGAVPVRLTDWRVSGAPCAARGFSLRPCAALLLAPNETRALHLAYSADWTQARAHATLTLRAGAARHAFRLAAAARAALLATCAARAPRPPFEPPLRALGRALALLALAVAAALAALDAERALRRHRARAHDAPPPRAALDLRALAADAQADVRASAPAAAPPRRRRTPRRRATAAADAGAERRAFSAWRAAVSRRAERSPSSEEGSPPAAPPPPPPPPRGDASSSSPDSSPPPARSSADGYASTRRSADEEGASTGSDSSSGSGAPPAPAPPAAPAAPPGPLARHARAARRSPGAAPPAPAPAARAARPRKERSARRRTDSGAPGTRAPPPAPAAPLRWGAASWSAVVSRGAAAPADGGSAAEGGAGGGAPLAPIGSDVRRRGGAQSHSLFYYGPGRAAPPPDVWGAEPAASPAAAWLWGAGPLRPPPGFAAVRPYDPFHSLASIWTPAALDLPPPPAPPAPRRDEAQP